MNITFRWGATSYFATNYGLSGLVETHMDPWVDEKGEEVSEARMELVSTSDIIATFIGWLTNVPGRGDRVYL